MENTSKKFTTTYIDQNSTAWNITQYSTWIQYANKEGTVFHTVTKLQDSLLSFLKQEAKLTRKLNGKQTPSGSSLPCHMKTSNILKTYLMIFLEKPLNTIQNEFLLWDTVMEACSQGRWRYTMTIPSLLPFVITWVEFQSPKYLSTMFVSSIACSRY